MRSGLLSAACLTLMVNGLPALANAAEHSIDAPKGEHLQTELYARGVQIYRCAAADADAKTGNWVF